MTRKDEKGKPDFVGDSIKSKNAGWSFGGDMADKFDSHVSRSVPLYDEGHSLIVKLSDFFLSDDSLCYDLGCSTGVLIEKIAERNLHRRVRFVGVDREEGMLQKARERTARFEGVEFVHSDLFGFEFGEPADMIVAYYTVQFIKPRERQQLFNRIYEALQPGGALVLFEKVRAEDARFQDMMTALYNEFKLEMGYSSEEIMAKMRSLKGVLEPATTQKNMDYLHQAGFRDVMSVMKFVTFEGFLAVK